MDLLSSTYSVSKKKPGARSGLGAYSMVLRLHDMRMLAIIAINPNERRAK
jgi:hypothetical protein